jgi:hypothetical protein
VTGAATQTREYVAGSEQGAPCTFWTGGFDYARYVRAEMPAHALGAKVADPASRPDEPLSLQRGPVAVWQRVGTLARANLVAQQKQDGIFTILETDDDYTRLHREHGWVEHLTPNFPPEQACVELHRMVAGHVDRVIVSTEKLAEVYGELNDDVMVCRNAIDPAHWPERPEKRDERLTFAWLGSSDHWDERMMASHALQPLRGRDDVRVVWLGVRPLPVDQGWIEHVPWTDSWTEWRETAAQLCIDVGLAFLNDAPMNQYRSDLKVLEYCALGALPVVQYAEPYRHLRPGMALFCRSHEWREKLVWCADNPAEVGLCAAVAIHEVFTHRTIRQTVEEWRNAVRPA